MTAQDLMVSIDRVLPASPEHVYEALITPALFARWMGPEGSIVTIEEMTLALGGRLSFTVDVPEMGSFRLYGFYEEIDPPRRLVHSWAMEGEDEISTVVFELEPHGDGTRLLLTHHGLTSPEDVAQNDGGWNHQLDRLELLLG